MVRLDEVVEPLPQGARVESRVGDEFFGIVLDGFSLLSKEVYFVQPLHNAELLPFGLDFAHELAEHPLIPQHDDSPAVGELEGRSQPLVV